MTGNLNMVLNDSFAGLLSSQVFWIIVLIWALNEWSKSL